MRGKTALAMAMRAPSGEIVIHTEKLTGIYTSNLSRIPFVRGLVALWDALGLGIRLLTVSANQQTGEDEKIEGPTLYITLAVSLSIGIGLFFLLPALAGHFSDNIFKWSPWWGNLVEGIIRLVLLVVYIWAIGKMPDIQRVFAYHGAEHKTINAFEAGAELTPESVSRFSREHPRCGTAFLLTLMVISVLVFSLLGPLPVWTRLISRVVMIPVIAGIAYEYIRWTANHLDSPLVRILVRPNLALQNLTTREPSLDIIEVSIAAFNCMLDKEIEAKTVVA
jgi:uncharacterized protein YqhQ